MPKKASAAPAAATTTAAPAKAASKAKTAKSKAAPAKTAAKPDFVISLYAEDVIKPDDQRNGINIGVNTGLRFTHYVNQLLYNNYESQLTDEELEAKIMEEFPNRESIQDMGRYRACFNAGSAGFGVPDEEGNAQKLPKENRLPKFGGATVAAE